MFSFISERITEPKLSRRASHWDLNELFIFATRWQCCAAYVYRIACAFHHCKKRSGKGYDGPRSELYSNSSRKMQAAALAGSFTIVCRAAAVGRWLSVRLSVPRSCCRSSQLPGGEIIKAKIQTKTHGIVAEYSLGDPSSHRGKIV